MVMAIIYTLITTVSFYAQFTSPTATNDASHPSHQLRLPRLLSGWSNIGNSITHILLIIVTIANKHNESDFWIKERVLGGIEGPVVLALLNFTAGMLVLRGTNSMANPQGWNSFVAISGSLLPVVWHRFIEEGLETWPCVIIFLWFAIFAMELTAFASSVLHFALRRGIMSNSKTD